MARQVKCYSCEEKGQKEEMEFELSPSGARMHYHKGECWEKRLKHKAFIENDLKEKDELNKVIMELHQIPEGVQVPSQFWTAIQDLRNGSYLYKGKVRKYKQGFEYPMITETYLVCKNAIKQARKTKNFDGLMSELRYCLAIVKDKIVMVKKKKEKLVAKKVIEEQKSQLYAEVQQDEPVDDEKNIKRPVKKHGGVDISRFLD